MKVSKKRALKLIDAKIDQFERVLANATYENRYDEAYLLAYNGTESLLTELFSANEATKFKSVVEPNAEPTLVGVKTEYRKLKDYQKHVKSCISQLKVYKERISNFWNNDKPHKILKPSAIPFISMSFDDKDREINTYVMGILKSLRIDFETGERYSKSSIPAKVMGRIRKSGIFIIVFVRDEKLEEGYTTPSWLLKELGIAQGCKKEIIAWVEAGIKDIVNLNYEKEVIYFDRGNLTKMQKATLKFLEALKEHNLA